MARLLPQPLRNLGVPPASEAACKELHASAAKATNNVLLHVIAFANAQYKCGDRAAASGLLGFLVSRREEICCACAETERASFRQCGQVVLRWGRISFYSLCRITGTGSPALPVPATTAPRFRAHRRPPQAVLFLCLLAQPAQPMFTRPLLTNLGSRAQGCSQSGHCRRGDAFPNSCRTSIQLASSVPGGG